VEYLQGQRARAMMMAKLAEAVAEVDVYLVPANSGGGGGGRGRGGAAGGAPRPASAGRHFNMANIAGYPAISVPHGFAESGSPTALTFYGPPFAEREILQLAKAYQDASGFHLKHPSLDAAAPAPKSM
jgi:Asp-tRNA(Asn)/Glu-tRNA(Gln) amidotransferase A subunit family amidase